MKNRKTKSSLKRTADIMTITGLLMAFALMLIGIVLTKTTNEMNKTVYLVKMINLESFWDPTSLIIVVGGTVACLMISFPGRQLAKVPKHLQIIFSPRKYEPETYIDQLVEMAKTARVNGLLSLEEQAEQIDDAFMKNSVQMIVDSVDPEKVKTQMESWLEELDERHYQERVLYDKGAALGPAFGMIGTLIGLINMLKELQDIESVGPNMSVALITTLYGSMLANIIFAPISNKLAVRHDEEFLCKRIICEGVQAIQSGENPNLIRDRLMHMLPEYQQKKILQRKSRKKGADSEEEQGVNA